MFEHNSTKEKKAMNKFIEYILIFTNDMEMYYFEKHILEILNIVTQLNVGNNTLVFGLSN